MRIVYFIKGLLIAPFCMALTVAYFIIGIAFGLFLIIGKPRFRKNLVAVIAATCSATFDEVTAFFRRFTFGETRGS